MDAGMGSFGSALGYYALAFLMVIWMVIKIARSSGILAVLTFFFWPLALVSLVRNWGDPDTDIRIPFFATVAALVLSVVMANRGVDQVMIEAAPHFTEEELRLIEAENPEAYAVIMQARADYETSGGIYEDADFADDEAWQDAAPVEQRSAPAAQAVPAGGNGELPEPAQPVQPLDPLLDLAQSAAALSYQYSRVAWPQLKAELQLPSRFRFIQASRLHRMARLRSQPLLPGSLGWVTHEAVDLGQPEAWVLEVRHVASPALSLGESAETLGGVLAGLAGGPLVDGSGRSLGSGAFAPQWDAERTVLTWSQESPEGYSDHHAVLPLREGALLFSMRGLQPDQRELGLRMSRLMAASVQLAPDQRWRDPGTASTAAPSLLQWVQGREPRTLTVARAAP